MPANGKGWRCNYIVLHSPLAICWLFSIYFVDAAEDEYEEVLTGPCCDIVTVKR